MRRSSSPSCKLRCASGLKHDRPGLHECSVFKWSRYTLSALLPPLASLPTYRSSTYTGHGSEGEAHEAPNPLLGVTDIGAAAVAAS
eukprot:5805496-Prymnesium_polylepis.2